MTAPAVLTDTALEARLVGACIHNEQLLRLVGDRMPNEGVGFIRTAPELRAVLGVLLIWHARGEYDALTNETRLIELLARVDRQGRDERWWVEYFEGIWHGPTIANLPLGEAMLEELLAKYSRHDVVEHGVMDLYEHGEIDDSLADALYLRLGQAITRRKNRQPPVDTTSAPPPQVDWEGIKKRASG